MKTCTRCKLEKPFAEFSPNKALTDGHASRCKLCNSQCLLAKQRELGAKPRTVVRNETEKLCHKCKRWKVYAAFYKDARTKDGYTAACRDCHTQYRQAYTTTEQAIKVRRARVAWQRRNDVNYKITACLRGRVRQALKKTKKSAVTMQLVGCELAELKRHIESLWLPGMSWASHAPDGWHIDHIRPCASFDLTDPEQQRTCFHYTNLQPLWAHDNRVKGDKEGLEAQS